MRLAPRSYPRRFFRNLNYLAASMKFSTPSSIGESTSQRLTFKRSYNKQQGTWQLWLKPRQNSRHLVQRRIALNTVEGSSVDKRSLGKRMKKKKFPPGSPRGRRLPVARGLLVLAPALGRVHVHGPAHAHVLVPVVGTPRPVLLDRFPYPTNLGYRSAEPGNLAEGPFVQLKVRQHLDPHAAAEVFVVVELNLDHHDVRGVGLGDLAQLRVQRSARSAPPGVKVDNDEFALPAPLELP